MRSSFCLLIFALAVSGVGCSDRASGSVSLTKPSPVASAPSEPAPVPAPVRKFLFTGRVHQTEPTGSFPVPGALVTIRSGPHAGDSFITDALGRFQFEEMDGPGFVVSVTKLQYDGVSRNIPELTGNLDVDVALAPNAATVTYTFSGPNTCTVPLYLPLTDSTGSTARVVGQIAVYHDVHAHSTGDAHALRTKTTGP